MSEFVDLRNLVGTTIQSSCEEDMQEGDYYQDGLLYCGKCNTPKQGKTKLLGLCRVMCKCESIKYREEERIREKNQRIELYKSLLEEEYRNIYFKDDDGRYPIDFAKNYVEHFDDTFYPKHLGLYIYGDFGNGKTYIASMIANELIERGNSVVMLTVTQAVEKMDTDEDFKRIVKNVSLLIIDDFGMTRNTEYQKERVCNLINTRYEAKLPIIVTSNLDRKSLLQTHDMDLGRVYNRIIEMTHPVCYEAPGRRKKESQNRYNEIDSVLYGNTKKGK